ncbi:MAG: hypothetical protein ACYTGH_12600 [Planctomycetota bacterium]|jgi:hypothetical protein
MNSSSTKGAALLVAVLCVALLGIALTTTLTLLTRNQRFADRAHHNRGIQLAHDQALADCLQKITERPQERRTLHGNSDGIPYQAILTPLRTDYWLAETTIALSSQPTSRRRITLHLPMDAKRAIVVEYHEGETTETK